MAIWEESCMSRPGGQRRRALALAWPVWAGALAILLLPAGARAAGRAPETEGTAASASRGICLLASSVGADYPVDAIVRFVEAGHFSPVVLDWAWITAHWDVTNFAEVNRLVRRLSELGVSVAAMYRPRALAKPGVPYQVQANGEPATDHGFEICFTSEEARAWGLHWGEQILERCPGIDEVIVYNPRNMCACPRCREAQAAGVTPEGQVWRFLEQARTAWRAVRAQAKLGVVYTGEPQFWQLGKDILDVAHPYLYLQEGTNLAQDIAAACAVRDLVGDKMGACLAKITWGETDKVAPSEIAQFDQEARRSGLSYFLWTFDTPFLSGLYDHAAVAAALSLDWLALRTPLVAMGLRLTPLTPEEARELVVKASESQDWHGLSALEGCSEEAASAVIAMAQDAGNKPRLRAFAFLGLGFVQSPRVLEVALEAAVDPDDAV